MLIRYLTASAVLLVVSAAQAQVDNFTRYFGQCPATGRRVPSPQPPQLP